MGFANRILTGTIIVAVRTHNEIIVGADSKVTRGDNTLTKPLCKIFQVGNIFYARAKFAGDLSDGSSIDSVVTKAIRGGGTIGERLTRFIEEVNMPLYYAIAPIRREAPQIYRRMVGNGSAFEIAFFGIEKGTPMLCYRTLTPYFPANPVTFDIQGGDNLVNPDDKPAYLFLGHTQPLIDLMNAQPDYWKDADIVAGVRQLVKHAIDNGDFCGEPITIMRVGRKGAEWIDKAKHCPKLKNY